MTSLKRAVASVLVCALAQAPLSTRAATSGPGIVVYRGGDDARARDAAGKVARWKLGDPAGASWEAVPLSESAEWGPGRAWVTGTDAPERCQGNPVALDALWSSLKAVRREIDDLLLDQARRDLDLVEAALPCLAEIPNARDLSEPPFLRGVLESYASRLDSATDAFRAALAFDPARTWDDSYSPDVKKVFDQARQGLAVSTLAAAKVKLTITSGSQAFLDGRSMGSGEQTVAPGRHLFQVKRGNRVSTLRFGASAAREVRLYDGDAAFAAATSGAAGSEVVSLFQSLAKVNGRTRACAWVGKGGEVVACWADGAPLAQVGPSPDRVPDEAVATAGSGTDAGATRPVSAVPPATGRVDSVRRARTGTAISVGVLVSGGLAAGAGGAMTAWGWSKAAPIDRDFGACIDGADEPPVPEGVDCDAKEEEYIQAFNVYVPGLVILGVGGGAVLGGLIGLVVSRSTPATAGLRFVPSFGPGGAAFSLTAPF